MFADECEAAFSQLKQALVSAPILAYPDFSQLYVDASNDAIGMVLGQIQNRKEVVIAYAGLQFNQAKRSYSVTEREALMVVKGIKHFQTYLHGCHFTVHTDHNVLHWLVNVKDPTGHLAHWSLLLQQYNFNIEHSAGINNGNVNVLSPQPYTTIAAFDIPGPQLPHINDMQRKDSDLVDIIFYLENQTVGQ